MEINNLIIVRIIWFWIILNFLKLIQLLYIQLIFSFFLIIIIYLATEIFFTKKKLIYELLILTHFFSIKEFNFEKIKIIPLLIIFNFPSYLLLTILLIPFCLLQVDLILEKFSSKYSTDYLDFILIFFFNSNFLSYIIIWNF